MNPEITPPWHDPSIDLPERLETVLLVVGYSLMRSPYDGFRQLGSLNVNGEWVFDVDLEGNTIPCGDPYIVLAWTHIPASPSLNPDINSNEPILLADGTVLDPVTREVVNHLPKG